MSHFMTKFSKKQDALSQALGCLQSIQHFPLSHCGYTAPFFMFTCSIIQGLSSDLLSSYCVTWCAIMIVAWSPLCFWLALIILKILLDPLLWSSSIPFVYLIQELIYYSSIFASLMRLNWKNYGQVLRRIVGLLLLGTLPA